MTLPKALICAVYIIDPLIVKAYRNLDAIGAAVNAADTGSSTGAAAAVVFMGAGTACHGLRYWAGKVKLFQSRWCNHPKVILAAVIVPSGWNVAGHTQLLGITKVLVTVKMPPRITVIVSQAFIELNGLAHFENSGTVRHCTGKPRTARQAAEMSLSSQGVKYLE